MKKMFVFGIVVGAILALGAMAFSVYSATSANAASNPVTSLLASGFGNGRGNLFQGKGPGAGIHGDGPLQSYVEEAVAEILGISIEDLQAVKEDGTKMSELLETAGLTAEEFQTALDEATPGIVEQALADEAITQEQADFILENGLRGFGRHGGPGGFGGFGLEGDGVLQPYIEAAVAEILGISVEDLQVAKDAGTKMSELLTTAELTEEEFKTALEAALPDIVAQALADEAITQEQADSILANGLRSFGGHGGHGDKGGFGLRGDGVLQPYIEAAVAEVLGMSVEDLQAALDDGTRIPELLDTAGMTVEEFQTAMEAAVPGIVEQALADGVITQAQADTILENGLRGAKGYIRSALQEYVDAAVADILGVTVEELQTARDNHTVADLLDAAGLTREEVQTALDEATPSILEQAVADGLITQAQADLLLEQGLHGFGGRGGGHGGHGPHGGGPGGFGPGGPGSDTQDAPTTDTSSENG